MTRRDAIAIAAASAASAQPQSKSAQICFMTATELARRIRRKDLSARDVLAAHLERIERLNPKVNAIVTIVPEMAEKAAALADEAAARGRFLGPLHGLPMAHKDLVDTKGIRTTYGSPIFKDHTPTANSLMVDRLQAAGAITIGKTNTPEFGAGSQTFNKVFGATRNPWDLTKTCGGSSGGAAVALACRMLPICDGSDTGGSLRNPGAFNSVVGLRTSPGRVPRVPSSYGWNTLSVLGPLARTVADVALLLSAMAGPDPRAPLSIEEPGARFAKPLGRDLKGVRVGWLSRFGGIPVDRRVRNVLDAQRRKLEQLGCIVEEADPDFSGADEAFKILRALSFHQRYKPLLEKNRSLMKATVIQEIERGDKLTGAEVGRAESLRSQLHARIGDAMTKYEFLAGPVTQVPPFDLTQEFVTEIEGVKMPSYIDWMQSCYFITMTALPAISVPAGFTPEGLPVGLQLVGRHQDDWGVLQLAHGVEEANGIFTKAPEIASGA